MTVKVRYQEPDVVTSSLMSVAVPSKGEMTAPLGFAAAVAEFGMLLRDSEFKRAVDVCECRPATFRPAWRSAPEGPHYFVAAVATSFATCGSSSSRVIWPG
jgi:Uncharacterized protein YfbK, C-terminal